jgi:hypothetical protein
MTFILQKKEHLDALSTRWIEPVEGLRIKVASAAKEGYKNDFRVVMRHVQALSGQHGIGTEGFSVLKMADLPPLDSDKLFVELACKHLVIDWEGVAEADDPGKPTPYTPERGVLLMEQLPEIYFVVMQAAQAIALRQKEQAAETLGKSSTPTAGPSNGRAKRTSAKEKSTNA